MRQDTPAGPESTRARSASALRVGLTVLLVVGAFQVLQPFLLLALWAVIIAVSAYPVCARIQRALGGRPTLAATLTVVLAILVLVVPSVYVAETVVTTVEKLKASGGQGGIHIPPPPPSVGDIPLIGPLAERYWTRAASGDGALHEVLQRHLRPVVAWLASAAAGISLTLVQFLLSVLMAGVLMARAGPILSWTEGLVARLLPQDGAKLARLAQATLRNVSRGVIGVALIQALLAGIGFAAVGIPAAGLWALLCFGLSVIQIGTLPVVLPIALYAFASMDLVVAVPFALWCTFVGTVDNILRPLLMHHGLSSPLWVILLGSIGGILSFGIIGLFVGPVVLVLVYELAGAWLGDDATAGPAGEGDGPQPDTPPGGE